MLINSSEAIVLIQEISQDRVPETVEEKRPAEVLTLDSTKNEGRDGGDSNLGNSPSNEDLSRPAERLKLNLKLRSQPADQLIYIVQVSNVIDCHHTGFSNSLICTDSLSDLEIQPEVGWSKC